MVFPYLSIGKFLLDTVAKGLGPAGSALAARTPAIVAVRIAWPLGRTLGLVGNRAAAIRERTFGPPGRIERILTKSASISTIGGGSAFWRGAAYPDFKTAARAWLTWWGETIVLGESSDVVGILRNLDDVAALTGIAVDRAVSEGLDADEGIALADGMGNWVRQYMELINDVAGGPLLSVGEFREFHRMYAGALSWLVTSIQALLDRSITSVEDFLEERGRNEDDLLDILEGQEDLTRGEAAARFSRRLGVVNWNNLVAALEQEAPEDQGLTTKLVNILRMAA